jgi:hypothetical protein
LISLLAALLKDQMVDSPQGPVRGLEVPFLLESAKAVFGTLVKERDCIKKSAKVFDVMVGRNRHIHCGTRPWLRVYRTPCSIKQDYVGIVECMDVASL